MKSQVKLFHVCWILLAAYSCSTAAREEKNAARIETLAKFFQPVVDSLKEATSKEEFVVRLIKQFNATHNEWPKNSMELRDFAAQKGLSEKFDSLGGVSITWDGQWCRVMIGSENPISITLKSNDS